MTNGGSDIPPGPSTPDAMNWHARSDLDLIAAARANDQDAVAELFARHFEPALKFARRLTDPITADDVAADGFARVLDAIRAGKGPTVAFRPYLLTAVRNAHVDYVRREARYLWIADHVESGVEPSENDVVEQLQDSQLLADAFSSLPERWQVVLWHSTVDGEDQETIGRLLGIKANAVAALRFRAREGLRLAYLSAHLAASAPDECLPVRDLLPGYVRDRLPRRKRDLVDQHLETCRSCSSAVAEVGEISSTMGVLLLPALMGSSAAGHLGASAMSDPLRRMHQAALQAESRRPAVSGLIAAAAALATVVATVGVAVALNGSEPDPVAGGRSEASPATETSTADASPSQHLGPGSSSSHTTDPQPTSSDRAAQEPPVSLPTSRPPVTASPTTHPTTDPPVTASPTASPSTSPTTDPPVTASPTTSPTTSPSAGTRENLSLSAGSVVEYPRHHHVEMSVATPLAPSYVTLEVRGLVSATVHREVQYVQATCATPTDPAAGGTSVVCELPAGSGVLAIDLVADDALHVSARIWAPDNADPRPKDDTLVFGTP